EAKRRDAALDPDDRRLRLGGSVTDRRGELPDQAVAGEPCARSPAIRRLVPVERSGARTRDESDPAAATAAETAGRHESAVAERRSEELLDLHEHAARQRASRRHRSEVRLRGGPGPSRGFGLSRRVEMSISKAVPIGLFLIAAGVGAPASANAQ